MHNWIKRGLWGLCVWLCVCSQLMMGEDSDFFGAEQVPVAVQVQVKVEKAVVKPGEVVWVAVHFELQAPWHMYWKQAGDVGMPTQLEWELPEGLAVVATHWPVPKSFENDNLVSFGYDAPFTVLVQLQVPQEVAGKEPLTIGLETRWLTCSEEMCLPGEAEQTFTLPFDESVAAISVDESAFFNAARAALPQPLPKGSVLKTCDQMLALQGIPSEELGSLEQVHRVAFWPEKKGIINYHAFTGITTEESRPGTFTAMLPLEVECEGQQVQGVLVLQGSDKIMAYQVDLPLPDNKLSSTSDEMALLTVNKPRLDEVAGGNEEFAGGIAMALVLALLGGLCLNLMPCVLPVISLKVLSFVKLAGEQRSIVWRHGLAFSAGVVVSFWVLAGFLLVLQAYGRAVGWGFQLQDPLFVAALAAVLLLAALNLFGVCEFGTLLASWAGNYGAQAPGVKKRGLMTSFSSGVLATAVATPCTGPFLGSAVGFAVTLPPLPALSIFTALGIGMSLPYLLLAAYPQLLRFIPKPGNWMVVFKQLMGFMMLATVLWLTWVFGAQTSTLAVILLLTAYFGFTLAAWIHGQGGSPLNSQSVRLFSLAVVMALFVGSGKLVVDASAMPPTEAAEHDIASNWEPFDPDRIAALRQQKIPVFIDFTAKWCLICQANHLVLSTEQVSHHMNEQHVVKMKADWTKGDPVIAAWLRKFGRSGVPLYLFYDANGEPQVLPQVLTPQIVADALLSSPST